MVDEYQDTNRPQYLLIRRLAEVAPQPVRRRRSRSVDLQVARRRPAEHPRLRAGLPRGDDRQARAQLPLDADHPRRRVGGHQPEPQPQGQAPLDRPQGRRPDRLLPRRRRARGGRLHHAHRARGPRRRRRRDGRGALPDQRAVAHDRRRADARGARLQDRRRRPVLRAQGNQGRARLHAARHQPARRREPAAGDQRAGARHRQGRDGRARERSSRRRPTPTTTCRCCRPACSRRWSANSLWARLVRGLEERAFTGRAAASLAVFRDLIVSLTEIARQEPVSIAIGKMLDRSGYLQDLREDRSEDAEGADREPRRARVGRARVREPRAGAVARRLRRSAVAALGRRRGSRARATRASG